MAAREKRLHQLAAALGIQLGAGSPDPMITGITEDTRRLSPGGLFVAIPGTAQDGVRFAGEAVRRGAGAIVAEQPVAGLAVPLLVVSEAREALARLAAAFYGEPTRELLCIGVTGTNGKTSVCHWAAHLLGAASCALVGTVANEAHGVGGLTTPPSPVVQRIAREAVDAGKQALIIEASSIGLAQRRLDAVDLDIAAFTNFTADHLEWHGTEAAYMDAKAMLFRGLSGEGWAVVHAQGAAAEQMLAATRGRPFRVGRRGSLDLHLSPIGAGPADTRFRLRQGEESVDTWIPFPGRHNVDNALVAAGIACCAGTTLRDIGERLPSMPAVPGRWETYHRPDGKTAIVDFAHNRAGLLQMLTELKSRFDRVIVVFGMPGETRTQERRLMGEVAGRQADLVIVTSDNPKDENPSAIAREIGDGVEAVGGSHEVIVDRVAAIEKGVDSLGRRSAAMLVAGKGPETFQIIQGAHVPHSDRAVLESLGFERRDSEA